MDILDNLSGHVSIIIRQQRFVTFTIRAPALREHCYTVISNQVLDELGEPVDELGRTVGVHLLEWKEAVRGAAIAMDVVGALLPISE